MIPGRLKQLVGQLRHAPGYRQNCFEPWKAVYVNQAGTVVPCPVWNDAPHRRSPGPLDTSDKMEDVTRQDLLAEARKLPLDERAELAAEILKTLDEVSEAESEALWNREVDRRIRAAREQGVPAIPGEEVLARARTSTPT